jgi:4'-phosphopantetheinyl transferase
MMSETGTTVPSPALSPAAATLYLVEVPDTPRASDEAVLSPEERAKAARFLQPGDRSRFVTTRTALRRVLGDYLSLAAEAVPLEIAANGRPFVAVAVAGTLDFNVSHSGALGAIVVATGRRVGVDVETLRDDRGLRELVPTVMGETEQTMLRSLPDHEFVRAFYHCWTRKEAIVKALGDGLSYAVQSIDVPALPSDGLVRLPGSVWTMRTDELPGYSLSVALEGEGGVVRFGGRP